MKIARRNADNSIDLFTLKDKDALHLLLFTKSIANAFKKLHPDEYETFILKELNAAHTSSVIKAYELYTRIFPN